MEYFTSVSKISDDAFNGCVSLVKIIIPQQITYIGKSAFSQCSNLKQIDIPDNVVTIGSNAFNNCKSLSCATIGNGVKTIGESAFYNCTSLENVYCKPNDPPRLNGQDVFMYTYYLDLNGGSISCLDCIGCAIYVPTQSVDRYKDTSYWGYYSDYILPYDFAN